MKFEIYILVHSKKNIDLETFDTCMIKQLVDFPTRLDNTLDLLNQLSQSSEHLQTNHD